MTKAAAYAVRTQSRKLIGAFVFGTFAAVVVCSAYAASTIPALSRVPLYLFWIFISLGAFRYRTRLRRLPAGVVVFLIGLEVVAVANIHGFHSDNANRIRQYEALMVSVRSDDVVSAERILNRYGDPDFVPGRPVFRSSNRARYDEEWLRPIDIAIEHGNLTMAQALVAHGAILEESGSCLEAAVQRNDVPMLRFLLDHGVDPNGPVGNSAALVRAVSSNQPAAVALLLTGGANPESWDRTANTTNPTTCLSLAQDMNSREIVLLLRRAGATQ